MKNIAPDSLAEKEIGLRKWGNHQIENGNEILADAGKTSAERAKTHAEKEKEMCFGNGQKDTGRGN